MTPLIELREVRKIYHGGALAVEALRGVSLSIGAGEYVAIMGSSGSGKSTLMHILGCLDRPSAGLYLFDGEDVSELSADELAELRSHAFGFVFQQYNLLASATAEENVEIPAIYAGAPRRARIARARELLEALGLGARAAHRPNELSGGQQQRVSIARALMNGPRVILADEPTGALDTASGRDVLALLGRLNEQGHTVILITHDESVAAAARRRIRIVDGLIVEDEGEASAHGALAAVERPRSLLAAWSELGEALRMALRSMRAHALRTALTLLGVIVGVAAVIAMLAIGEGAKRDVLSRIEAMGSNLLLVRPLPPRQRTTSGVVAQISLNDVAEMRRLPGVVGAAPELWDNVTVRFGNADHQTSLVATGHEYAQARDWPMAAGDFLDREDFDSYAPVATLGLTVVGRLFTEGENPVGQYVFINNAPFLVIGVMGEKGAAPWGGDLDDNVFIPMTTGVLRLFGARPLRAVTVQVDRPENMAAVQTMIEALLQERYSSRDLQVRNMTSQLETTMAAQNTLTVLLGAIAAISLLVGGVGVMNIMLVSVSERTREIGVRMATGARSRDILRQFIAEAVMVCALGGALGVAIGLGATWAISRFDTPVFVEWPPVALAFGCAFATGLLFGWMPARKAARLDPVAALSAE